MNTLINLILFVIIFYYGIKVLVRYLFPFFLKKYLENFQKKNFQKTKEENLNKKKYSRKEKEFKEKFKKGEYIDFEEVKDKKPKK
ncbi:MAG: hypothetical protein B6I24_09670 [Bacteroidetes bacterium 4572_128]|nr:MAG: hypothetical protein B6I24_09670 [Bacteroidetes bacterium 4572_128]